MEWLALLYRTNGSIENNRWIFNPIRLLSFAFIRERFYSLIRATLFELIMTLPGTY